MDDEFDQAMSEFLAVDRTLADLFASPRCTRSGSIHGFIEHYRGSPTLQFPCLPQFPTVDSTAAFGLAPTPKPSVSTHLDSNHLVYNTPQFHEAIEAYPNTPAKEERGPTPGPPSDAMETEATHGGGARADFNANSSSTSQFTYVTRINFSGTQHRQFALTRPLFCGNRIVVGTEFPLDPSARLAPSSHCGGLVLGEWNVPWTSPAMNDVRNYNDEFVATEKMLTDIQWVIPGEVCVYASETDIQLCRWDKRRTVLVDYAEEARTKGGIEIRQLAVRENRIVSGDSEKRLRLFSLGEHLNEKSLTLDLVMADTVGGVAWSPFSHDVLTYTLDHGALGMLDIREGRPQLLLPISATSENRRLFAHCAVSEYIYTLGYEDAKGRTIDIRAANSNKGGISRWADLELKHIGEFIAPDSNNSKLTVACGIGGFSVYNFSDGRATPLESVQSLAFVKDVPIIPDCYKTSGSFLPGGSNIFALTDSTGYLSFYDLSNLVQSRI